MLLWNIIRITRYRKRICIFLNIRIRPSEFQELDTHTVSGCIDLQVSLLIFLVFLNDINEILSISGYTIGHLCFNLRSREWVDIRISIQMEIQYVFVVFQISVDLISAQYISTGVPNSKFQCTLSVTCFVLGIRSHYFFSFNLIAFTKQNISIIGIDVSKQLLIGS